MALRWLLDTSGLLALRDDEPGADRVAELLQAALGGQAPCVVCCRIRMEVPPGISQGEGALTRLHGILVGHDTKAEGGAVPSRPRQTQPSAPCRSLELRHLPR